VSSIKITVLGSVTSQGVPVIACECPVCSSLDSKDKRLRSSILISAEEENFVIDAGPDFRQQMLRADVRTLKGVLFTHEHKDHTAGLDDVRAFNFKQKSHMDLYVDDNTEATLRREYQYAFSDNKYPGIPQLNLCFIGNLPNFRFFFVSLFYLCVYFNFTFFVRNRGMMETKCNETICFQALAVKPSYPII
jgi:phosphoribosyl 1,2-cyclic phosphate phosphodiesterase